MRIDNLHARYSGCRRCRHRTPCTQQLTLGTGRPVPAAAAAGVSGVQVIDPHAGAAADRDRRGSQASETASGAEKPAGFWQKLMDAAEQAQRQAESKKNREGKKDRKK
ncbi:MAG: hypothetical protein ACKPHU_31915, partial [Planctomycetaceae bacterium]